MPPSMPPLLLRHAADFADVTPRRLLLIFFFFFFPDAAYAFATPPLAAAP